MKHGVRVFVFCMVAVLVLTLIPADVHSCPVCFGDADSKMAEAVNAAIFVLLGITGSVLGLFTALFLRIRKRMKLTLNGSVDYPSMN